MRKVYLVEAGLLQTMVDYMVNRPYKEVNGFIEGLQELEGQAPIDESRLMISPPEPVEEEVKAEES